jgi:hypothetical protein
MKNEVIPPDSRTEHMMHYLIYNFCVGAFQENHLAEMQSQKLPRNFVQWVNDGDTFWY